MENISTATPDATATPTPETGTGAEANGTSQPVSEAGQGAPDTESFIPQGVDLNTLPPQVRAYVDEVNKQMVRGFKEKTTTLAERVKSEAQKAREEAIAAYKPKAEWYDAALKDEQLVKMINDYVSKASTSNDPSKVQLPPEIEERLQKVDKIEREIKSAKALESINAFAEAKDEKGNLLRPNFDKYHSAVIGTHPEAGDYSILRAAVELAPGNTEQEKMENGYKTVEAIWNKAFEEGKKAGMGRNQEKARNGTFSPSSVNAGSTAPRQPKNALEALQFARQGLAPNRG